MVEKFESFTFRHDSPYEALKIYFDPSGQFISSNTGEDHTENEDGDTFIQEPAYNFRVWSSSALISKYLENDFESNGKPHIFLELGAGLGLPSLVSSRLKVNHVIVSDLPIALPMIYHNLRKNFNEINPPTEMSVTKTMNFTCPLGHKMTETVIDAYEEGEYMCSICEDDISEPLLSRCGLCNFDICHKTCLKSIKNGNLSKLPLWFRAHLEYQNILSTLPDSLHSPCIHLSLNSTNPTTNHLEHLRHVHLMPCDWLIEKDRKNIIQKIYSITPETSASATVYIVGADITYNMKSVERLFKCLRPLLLELLVPSPLHQKGENNNHNYTIRLLLVHQVRSYDTTNLFLEELHFQQLQQQLKFNIQCRRVLLDVSQDSIGVDETGTAMSPLSLPTSQPPNQKSGQYGNSNSTVTMIFEKDKDSTKYHLTNLESPNKTLAKDQQSGDGSSINKNVYEFQLLEDNGVYLFDLTFSLC